MSGDITERNSVTVSLGVSRSTSVFSLDGCTDVVTAFFISAPLVTATNAFSVLLTFIHFVGTMYHETSHNYVTKTVEKGKDPHADTGGRGIQFIVY